MSSYMQMWDVYFRMYHNHKIDNSYLLLLPKLLFLLLPTLIYHYTQMDSVNLRPVTQTHKYFQQAPSWQNNAFDSKVCIFLYCFTCIYVTGFAKMGLPHTSNLPTSMICNFRLEQAIDLKFGQK